MSWAVGDRVRIGSGKVVWLVSGFFTRRGTGFVTLTKEGSNGYVNTSTSPASLRAVES